jgi:hypothetical protein
VTGDWIAAAPSEGAKRRAFEVSRRLSANVEGSLQTYFTQQQAPPGQPGQASQVQTPVSQQPQSQTQQQAPLQQLPAQVGAVLGAAPAVIEATTATRKKTNEYIKISN